MSDRPELMMVSLDDFVGIEPVVMNALHVASQLPQDDKRRFAAEFEGETFGIGTYERPMRPTEYDRYHRDKMGEVTPLRAARLICRGVVGIFQPHYSGVLSVTRREDKSSTAATYFHHALRRGNQGVISGISTRPGAPSDPEQLIGIMSNINFDQRIGIGDTLTHAERSEVHLAHSQVLTLLDTVCERDANELVIGVPNSANDVRQVSYSRGDQRLDIFKSAPSLFQIRFRGTDANRRPIAQSLRVSYGHDDPERLYLVEINRKLTDPRVGYVIESMERPADEETVSRLTSLLLLILNERVKPQGYNSQYQAHS
jgi:hypothetical protein